MKAFCEPPGDTNCVFLKKTLEGGALLALLELREGV